MGIAVYQEESLRHFLGLFTHTEAVSAHLALAVAEDPVGIQGEHLPLKVFSSAANFPQRQLKLSGLGYGMGVEQLVEGGIRGDKRQSIGDFKTLLGKGAFTPVRAKAESRFIDEMQGHPRFDLFGGLATPKQEQIPNPESEELRDEQPDAHLIARDFVGQQLANLALQSLG